MLDITQQATIETPSVVVPEPAQPAYPQTQINVHENGLLITITLAPGTQINQFLPEETMNAIAGKWLETRKEIKRQMSIIKPPVKIKH